MSKLRLRKAEAILTKLRIKNCAPESIVIEYINQEDLERQCAAVWERDKRVVIICAPKKRDVEYNFERETMETMRHEQDTTPQG